MWRERIRLGAAAEWFVALAFLAATVTVAILIVREVRTVRLPADSGLPPAPQTGPPPGLPDHAVSVPSLLLLDGKQIRVGDTIELVNALIPAASHPEPDRIEQGALGERITRTYQYAGTGFVVVFEPFERSGPPRVAAIYLR